jgi:ankyrin repeat protein
MTGQTMPLDQNSSPSSFPWLARIGTLLVLGSGALAARLICEMTVWTWERGPQMVGFQLIHGSGVLLLLFPLVLACWLLFGVVDLLWRWWKRSPVSYANLIVMALAIAVYGLLSPSYGFWERMFVDRLSRGPYAGDVIVHAAALGDLDTVKTFLAYGVSPDARSQSGSTALLGATVQGDTKVVEYLISAGADINATNGVGQSALQIAIAEQRDDVARVLRAHGAVTPQQKEQTGKSLIDEQMTRNSDGADAKPTDK